MVNGTLEIRSPCVISLTSLMVIPESRGLSRIRAGVRAVTWPSIRSSEYDYVLCAMGVWGVVLNYKIPRGGSKVYIQLSPAPTI